MKGSVRFEHVWKSFRRGERHDSLRDLVPALARRVLRRQRRAPEAGEFWVLRDVSFNVEPGEALGIIGANGAGKSTTLKLLSRILKPTKGTCAVDGRMGALIEVAAGFHPDLTGRENVFLQGAVMGMHRPEIAAKLDAIVAFAGVEQFIDTPVKRYSSGMNARLGFAIAAHLDPEVLIIDEVLSVGDMAFQKRCVEKMMDFKRQGVTIVFVSHDLQAVARLCDRTLLLNRAVGMLGPTHEVLREYVRASSDSAKAVSGGEITILNASLASVDAGDMEAVLPGGALRLSAEYEIQRDLSSVHFGFVVHRATDGLVIYDESVDQRDLGIDVLAQGARVRLDYTFNAHLTRGHYHVELRVYHTASQRFLAHMNPAGAFTVSETKSFSGVAHLGLRVAGASTKVFVDHSEPNQLIEI
jgi:lipopolysaccharide transport system ATP-binding protein